MLLRRGLLIQNEVGHGSFLLQLVRETLKAMSRDAPEEYALLRQRGGIESEASARDAAAKRAAPAIRITSHLMLGIRIIRACYLQAGHG